MTRKARAGYVTDCAAKTLASAAPSLLLQLSAFARLHLK